MATIEDVANLAGVSIATVSRVINNSLTVSEEKRKLVQQAIESLGYQPQRNSNKRNENKIIMLAGVSFVNDILAGMKETARKFGYEMLFNYFCTDVSEILNMQIVKSGLLDGLILMNMAISNDDFSALSAQIPVVQCGELQKLPNSFSVSINEIRASEEIVNHLIRLGRKRIAYVSSDLPEKSLYFVRERELGYRLALAENGMPVNDERTFYVESSIEGGTAAAHRILNMPQIPDAVFCATDYIAIGCMNTLIAEGIKVPEQIAVAGFDDMDIAEMNNPSLTTVAQPFYDIGCECVRMLISLIKEEYTIGRHIIIDHQLQLRASTIGEEAYLKYKKDHKH